MLMVTCRFQTRKWLRQIFIAQLFWFRPTVGGGGWEREMESEREREAIAIGREISK